MTNEEEDRRFALAEGLRSGYRRSGNRRWLFAVGLVVVLVVGGGALVGLRAVDEAPPPGPSPAGNDYGLAVRAEDISTKGATTKENAVEVQIWDDFDCPKCKAFQRTVAAFLRNAAGLGDVVVTYYPLRATTANAGNNYAQRAMQVALCVADKHGIDAYLTMRTVFFERQPGSGKPPVSTDRMIRWAGEKGYRDVDSCVAENPFAAWLTAARAKARSLGVVSTPTVRVEGRKVVSPEANGGQGLPDLKELKFAIESVRP